MNTKLIPRSALLLTVAASLLARPAQAATVQSVNDEIQVKQTVVPGPQGQPANSRDQNGRTTIPCRRAGFGHPARAGNLAREICRSWDCRTTAAGGGMSNNNNKT
jgi:hypothetical protein